jgi:hypothetical protein
MTGIHGTKIEDQDYHSYLLRLWRVTSARETTWRASLENPHTGECSGFPSLEALFRHLQDQIGACGSNIETKEGGAD